VAGRKRVYNIRRMEKMRDEVKDVKKLVLAQKFDDVTKTLPSVYKAIDKAAKRGVIKKNTAARKKSRIIALLRKHEAKAK